MTSGTSRLRGQRSPDRISIRPTMRLVLRVEARRRRHPLRAAALLVVAAACLLGHSARAAELKAEALLSIGNIRICRHEAAIRHAGTSYLDADPVRTIDSETGRRHGAGSLDKLFQLFLRIARSVIAARNIVGNDIGKMHTAMYESGRIAIEIDELLVVNGM